VGLTVDHFDVADTDVKLWASAEATLGISPVTVKFEVNCSDADPLLPLHRLTMGLETRWWSNSAEVLTFDPCELVGTKFRALAQRRKGRDLSDLWLARTDLTLNDTTLAAAADHYLAHEGITPAQLRVRLAEHERDPDFLRDLDVLTAVPYEGFDAITETRRLILWADIHLDHLWDRRRNPTAVRRDQRGRERGGWRDDALQCPVYARRDGNLTRCDSWVVPGRPCPEHPDAPVNP